MDQPNTTNQGQQPAKLQGSYSDFDPTKDIDISNIQIFDTSKGDKIDFGSVAYNEIFSFKCLNCGYKYEGKEKLDHCPRCGSDKIDDSQ